MAGVGCFVAIVLSLVGPSSAYTWLAGGLGACGGIAAIFRSRVERPAVVWIAIMLTIVPAISIMKRDRAEAERERILRRIVVREMAGRMNSLAQSISMVVHGASDGWLPSTEAELFSRRSVDLFCNDLDVKAKSDYADGPPWFAVLPSNIKEFRTGLEGLITSHWDVLRAEEIEKIQAITDNSVLFFIEFLPRALQYATERGFSARYTLCHGIEDEAERLFNDVRQLREGSIAEVRAADPSLPIEWGGVALPRADAKLGTSRWRPTETAQ